MRRSFTGPLLLVLVGSLFLWHTLHPEAQIFDMVARYWPFVLIAWGLIRLIEVSFWRREGVRASFSGGEVVLIVLICLARSGIWAAREQGPIFLRDCVALWGQHSVYPIP